MRMPRAARLAALPLLLISASALAEQGALSVEAGGGVVLERVPAPYVAGSSGVVGSAATIRAGVRYAVTHSLEVTGTFAWTPPVSFFHNGVSVTAANGDGPFAGTLQHRLSGQSVSVGGRYLLGMVWRPFVGLELGWAHRSFAGFQHIDDSDPSNPHAYALTLNDVSAHALLVAPVAGLEWVGDRISVSLAPRLELLAGSHSTWSFAIPLVVGWDFYLPRWKH